MQSFEMLSSRSQHRIAQFVRFKFFRSFKYVLPIWEQSHTIANGSDHCSSIWQLAPRKALNYEIPLVSLVHPVKFSDFTHCPIRTEQNMQPVVRQYTFQMFSIFLEHHHTESQYINRKLEIYCEMRRKIKKTT